MSDKPRLEVAEYESVPLPRDLLTDDDLRRLGQLCNRRRGTLVETRTGWRFRPEATAGVLTLDRIRLAILPKTAFTGRSLIQWLCYALGTPVPHETTTRAWTVERDGFADVVAGALLAECRTLLRDGLRRDYVRTEHVGPVLRGRLDAAAQATKRFGMLDRLHMRTFDREVDIWENQLCGHALRAAARQVTNSHLAREIGLVAKEFPVTGSPSSALRAVDRSRYTHLNRRYRAAHVWSDLLLRGGGVTDLLTDIGYDADSLLLDLPGLWEAVVRRLARESAPARAINVPSSGRNGITVYGDLSTRPPFRPDVLVRMGGPAGNLVPIDAKYKTYQDDPVSSADVHQLLTYIAGHSPLTAPVAAIVYPNPHRHSHRVLRVSGPGRDLGAIHVLGVHASADPSEATAWLRSTLWRHVVEEELVH
ncbi:McrC family protein [Nocardia amikacinitolerans]|uniref:McrC family protein n=1 Tax=Nocardia amikacinitolerans TaxID=756689 RepID=UPI003673F80A